MPSQWDVFIGGYVPSQVSAQVPWRKLAPHIYRLFFIDRGISLFPKLTVDKASQGYFFGDGDSRPAGTQKYVKRLPATHVHVYNPDKDFSDTEAAVRFARNHGKAPAHALFLGMMEGRADHHLANLFQWLEIHPQGPWKKLLVVGPNHQLLFFQGQVHIPLPAKTPCALFRNPLGHGMRGMKIEGMRYPLSHSLLKSASHGISNEVVKGYISVQSDPQASHVLMLPVPLKKLPHDFILNCL